MHATAKHTLALGGALVAGGLVARELMRNSRWFDFRDRVCIVTGGSRGLGLVIARKLADAGARVAICARTKTDLAAAEIDLRRRSDNILALRCDVRNPDDVDQMAAEVINTFGTVDVLFNVAGIIEVGPMEAMTLDDFHNSMDTNCWGALHTTLAVLPEMRRNQWGRIVNVASLGGKRAVPHLLPYAVSKFALVGLSNGLWTELRKDNIFVSTICPSLMNTGSPRNATFKGQNRKEFAWFNIGDSMPFVSMDPRQAAAQILRACQYGDREVLVRNPFNVAVFLQSFFPGLTQELLALMDRMLPQMGGIGKNAAHGYESKSAWSPSWLTRFGNEAARLNNEMRRSPSP